MTHGPRGAPPRREGCARGAHIQGKERRRPAPAAQGACGGAALHDARGRGCAWGPRAAGLRAFDASNNQRARWAGAGLQAHVGAALRASLMAAFFGPRWKRVGRERFCPGSIPGGWIGGVVEWIGGCLERQSATPRRRARPRRAGARLGPAAALPAAAGAGGGEGRWQCRRGRVGPGGRARARWRRARGGVRAPEAVRP